MPSTPSLKSVLDCLTKEDIVECVPENTFSRNQKRSRTLMEAALLQDPLRYADVLEQAAVKKTNKNLRDVQRHEGNALQTDDGEVFDGRKSSLKLILATLTQKEIVNAFPEDTFSRAQKRSRLLLEAVVLQDPERFGAAVEEAVAKKQKNRLAHSEREEMDTSQAEIEDNGDTLPLPLKMILASLSKKEIVEALPENTFSRVQKRSRSSMEEVVLDDPTRYGGVLEAAAAKKRKTKLKTVEDTDAGPLQSASDDSICPLFFETISEEQRRMQVSKFLDATGNDAISSGVCAVCAGRFFKRQLMEKAILELQKGDLLVPTRSQPMHILTKGMLLYRHPDCLRDDGNGSLFARVCETCWSSLVKEEMPALSLANGMWVGEIPLELKILTLPERILVGRFFPAAYIVKLFPRKKGSRLWAPDGYHSALQGNVSTYPLNTDDVSKITHDGLMPPSANVLAATVGVTFVGPKNVPQRTLPGFLRVNRDRVRAALQWLKANNPFYQNITISPERLEELPVDDIPVQITSTTRHLDDDVLLAEETDNYVPDNETGMQLKAFHGAVLDVDVTILHGRFCSGLWRRH